jgi:hypothetical protein
MSSSCTPNECHLSSCCPLHWHECMWHSLLLYTPTLSFLSTFLSWGKRKQEGQLAQSCSSPVSRWAPPSYWLAEGHCCSIISNWLNVFITETFSQDFYTFLFVLFLSGTFSPTEISEYILVSKVPWAPALSGPSGNIAGCAVSDS